ncbi:MAG: hypothetical protein LBD02_01955 [Christensenellaceae bacterium]|jgi:hypothetical protein|nr:hypothetical protein [Christensenellaceae bacterium]
MASYDKSKDTNYTLLVQQALSAMGANLGPAGIDGKWGAYTDSAYKANQSVVDAMLYGGSSSSAYGYAPQAPQMPELSLQGVSVPASHDYSYYYSIGDALEAENYERQKQQAESRLQGAQAQLETDLDQTKAGIAANSTARGFGRSTYVTDSLLYADNAAAGQRQSLLSDFSQTLLYLDAARHSGAARYASGAYENQQSRIAAAEMANAQIANQQALAVWNAQMDAYNRALSGYEQASSSLGSYSAALSSGSSRSAGSSRASSAAKSAAAASPAKQSLASQAASVLKQTIRVR